MPIFSWKCDDCEETWRKLLPKRPALFKCHCGGALEFVSSLTTRVIEVRDNGAMPRKVEQLAGIDEMIQERSQEPTDPDLI